MNPSSEKEALELAAGLSKKLGEETCPMDEENEFCTEVVIFPPHPFIARTKELVEEIGITVGAQSVFFEEKGAYTVSIYSFTNILNSCVTCMVHRYGLHIQLRNILY